jgi:hypothetical protein
MVGYWPGGYNDRAKKALPEGFWMADGDNNATNPVVNGKRTRVVNGRTVQFYSAANLAASAPCELMAVYPKIGIGVGRPDGFPEGWSDDGTTLTFGGVPVVKGFRQYLLAHPELVSGPHLADNTPIEAEHHEDQVEAWNPVHGAGTIQTFHKMRLVWTAKDDVYVMRIGDELTYRERNAV